MGENGRDSVENGRDCRWAVCAQWNKIKSGEVFCMEQANYRCKKSICYHVWTALRPPQVTMCCMANYSQANYFCA